VFKFFAAWGIILFLSGMLGAEIKVGLENLLENHLDLIKGKRLGIVANHTSLDCQGRHVVDLLSSFTRVTAVFAPEHGFYGNVENGASIEHRQYKNSRIYSLYGQYQAPTASMLSSVDILIYDIQDVGVKYYTYISTLFLCLKAAARAGIPVIVLDRPNPITASRVEGAVTSPAFSSLVGVIPLPVRYGMTIGELAKLFNGETFGGFSLDAELTIIPMRGYQRHMWYDETGFPWTGTSPNLQTLQTAMIYPGMCLLEGTNLSEGRGTESPFLTVGAPFIVPKDWLGALPDSLLAGVRVEIREFRPRDIPGVASNPKYKNQLCHGLHFTITDREVFRPIPLAVALICSARALYPEQFELKSFLDKLWGDESLRAMVSEGAGYQDILALERSDVKRFKAVRQTYLIYE
jgi:uncharacterized protein YbbC (DUF1343 family)